MVLLAFLSAAPLHSLVPHAHSLHGNANVAHEVNSHCHADEQQEGETPTWSFIHSSLAHECKKITAILPEPRVSGDVTVCTESYTCVILSETERLTLTQYERLLSRGILASRSFG